MRVVICGAGVIGSCLAYFLSRRAVEVVVVERTAVACAASGKSGGFLALDWCDGTPLGPLARRSFTLHAKLAAEPGADWGYRRMHALSVVVESGHGRAPTDQPGWLGPQARVQAWLATPDTAAQIHPAHFTRAMLDAAVASGAKLVEDRVTGIELSPDRRCVTGVQLQGELLASDAAVVAMGPWSILACPWLPLPATYGLKGNSIVLRADFPAHSLFVDLTTSRGGHTPELFPRPDGTVYFCGLSSEAPLPADPLDVAPDKGAAEALQSMASSVAPQLGGAPILANQACYRPVTRDGLPLMGQVDGIKGAYIATGHSVWGMLNGPASGEAMAELITEGRTRHVDLSAFHPGRLPSYRGNPLAS
jgi:glycine/D-amino acid oxidase-like deaminating enzyme